MTDLQPNNGDPAERRAQRADTPGADDPATEPRGDDDPTPEEAGYGYGV
jgi:hypothetical protein